MDDDFDMTMQCEDCGCDADVQSFSRGGATGEHYYKCPDCGAVQDED